MNLHLNISLEFAYHPLLTVLIAVFAGILGGFIGYMMNNNSIRLKNIEIYKSMIFGIGVSAGVIVVLATFYSELFVPTQADLINLVLTGCICFMFSVVILMFGYRFLMRMTSARKRTPINIGQPS